MHLPRLESDIHILVPHNLISMRCMYVRSLMVCPSTRCIVLSCVAYTLLSFLVSYPLSMFLFAMVYIHPYILYLVLDQIPCYCLSSFHVHVHFVLDIYSHYFSSISNPVNLTPPSFLLRIHTIRPTQLLPYVLSVVSYNYFERVPQGRSGGTV